MVSGNRSSGEEKLLRQQDVLAKFGELALRSDDLEEILQEACHLVGEALGTDLAKVMELQEDGITLLVRSGVGWKPDIVGQVTVRAEEGSSEGHALQTGEPVTSSDIATETRFRYPGFLTDNGVHALINVIIIGPDSKPPYGILEVDSRSPREFTEGDIAFLRGYANLLAGAVARLRLLDEARSREVALRDSEDHYRAAVELNPQIPWIADPNGNVRNIDPRWTEVTGLPLDTTAGADWMQAPHPEDLPEMVAAWTRAVATGEDYGVEVRLRSAGGGYRWTRVRASPRRADDGRIARWYGTTEDIEDRRKLETTLREWNETLEERVSERTSALEAEQRERQAAEEALRHSQKMEAVGQLTGGVAHDFNNLLTIIRSSVDLLRRPNLSEERRRRYIDSVSDTVDRAAKLTGQLLAFARRQTLKPEVFEVGARLRSIADMLDTVTGALIRVVTDVPEAPCFIEADPSQFETAVVNLAVNARDAIEGSGQLTLRLTCGVRMPPIRGHAGAKGPFVAVSLTDTGGGIPPETVARIFEPFFTTKEVGKGTGLGLSQVFGFTKQSGGDVAVMSEVGRGTTFTLYLPEVKTEASPAPADEGPDTPSDGAGHRVLVVEDNIEVGNFATQILQDLGYETAWAVNAEEALIRLGRDGNGFDVVFSDVVMPGMGGIALARELQQRLPTMPIVLASGYSHVLAQEGAHGFELLNKPYSIDQLSRTLRRAIRR